jgi:hypothetical protein
MALAAVVVGRRNHWAVLCHESAARLSLLHAAHYSGRSRNHWTLSRRSQPGCRQNVGGLLWYIRQSAHRREQWALNLRVKTGAGGLYPVPGSAHGE